MKNEYMRSNSVLSWIKPAAGVLLVATALQPTPAAAGSSVGVESAVLLRDQCVVNPDAQETPATLLLAAAPKIIELAFSVGTYLFKTEPDDYNGKDSAMAADTAFLRVIRAKSASGAVTIKPTVVNPCVIFVRGRFLASPSSSGQHIKEDVNKVWTASRLNSLGLVEKPEFYLESKLRFLSEKLPDGNGGQQEVVLTRIEPAFLDYAKTKAEEDGDGRKKLNVIYKFTQPKIDGSQDIFLEANVDMGTRTIGAAPVYSGKSNPVDRQLGTSNWQPINFPAAISEVQEGRPANLMPYSLSVTVEEAGEKSELRTKLEEGGEKILESVKEPLTEMIKKIIEEKLGKKD